MTFSAVTFRACAWETPLWSFSNTTDGRWNRAGEWPAQYLSLHPMIPWAEMLRWFDQRDADSARATRIPIWTVRIELADDPLEIHYSDMPAYALDPEDLVADEHDACQSLAASLLAGGTSSIVVPSAALPGTRNLVILEEAAVIDYDGSPIDPADHPAALVAQDGHCPEGLHMKVHFKRSAIPHAELAAFQVGADYAFEQPFVTQDSIRL